MNITAFRLWLAAFRPAPLHTRPLEWLRAGIGAGIGFFFSTWLCSTLYGLPMALQFSGPLAASSVLLFAVSSGALAQPWPIIGSYLCASLVGLCLAFGLGHGLPVAALALALSLVLMSPLRCLHPPGGALAFCMVAVQTPAGEPFWYPALAALCAGGALLASALFYNNLSRMPYPRLPAAAPQPHLTRDPLASERVGFSPGDLDQALTELGGFVDITPEALEQIIHTTEKYALRRSMGEIQAGQIMSRDLICAHPDDSIDHGLYLLTHHHLKALPIIDPQGRLVGILTLIDLLDPLRARRFSLRRLIGLKRREPNLGALMSSPVRSTRSDTHVVDLISLLSDQGLHCLPVVEDDRLVGVITQTDLVAALHRNLLQSR